jgi:hypothetical protein
MMRSIKKWLLLGMATGCLVSCRTSPTVPAAAGSLQPGISPAAMAAARQTIPMVATGGVQPWRGASLEALKLADQNPADPVLVGQVCRDGKTVGYFFLEAKPPHRLLEWGVDAEKPLVPGKQADALTGIANVQQFKGTFSGQTAVSGCVPSAAANVAAHWAKHGYPQIESEIATAAGMQRLVLNLRERFKVELIPDDKGYTDDGTTLTGAWPASAATGLRQFFQERQVKLDVSEVIPFDRKPLRQEIAAGRPVFLCGGGIRLPHKPWLTWGHALTAVGWAEIDGRGFVMVHDNFYPTRAANAARWLPETLFDSMVLVSPATNANH